MKKRITGIALFVLGLSSFGFGQTTEEEAHIQIIMIDDDGNTFELDTTFDHADFDLEAILAAYGIEHEDMDGEIIIEENIWIESGGDGELDKRVLFHERPDGEEMRIEVVEEIDEDGNTVRQHYINGELVTPEEMHEMHMEHGTGHHGMMMHHAMGENGEMTFEIEGEDGEMHEVSISMIQDDDGNMDVTVLMDGEELSEEEMEILHEMHMGGMPHGMMMMMHCASDDPDHECGESCMDGMDFTTDMNVRIEKEVDEEGNVTVKKYVNGEEVEDNIHHMDHHNVWVDDEGGTYTMVMTMSITREDEESNEDALKNVINKDELAVNDLSFNPNPSDGLFTLSFNLEEKGKTEIRIVDVNGKTIHKEKLGDFTGQYTGNIDISEEGPGIYFLQLFQGDKAMAEKIIIQ